MASLAVDAEQRAQAEVAIWKATVDLGIVRFAVRAIVASLVRPGETRCDRDVEGCPRARGRVRGDDRRSEVARRRGRKCRDRQRGGERGIAAGRRKGAAGPGWTSRDAQGYRAGQIGRAACRGW